MLLESLRYFLAVVKTMSFSEAAEELNISQSALSKKIKSLELDLDVLLFYRTTRAIQLTEAGTALVPLANEAVLLENRVEAQMRRFRLRTKEVLRIASCPVFHLYGMAGQLPQQSSGNRTSNYGGRDAARRLHSGAGRGGFGHYTHELFTRGRGI